MAAPTSRTMDSSALPPPPTRPTLESMGPAFEGALRYLCDRGQLVTLFLGLSITHQSSLHRSAMFDIFHPCAKICSYMREKAAMKRVVNSCWSTTIPGDFGPEAKLRSSSSSSASVVGPSAPHEDPPPSARHQSSVSSFQMVVVSPNTSLAIARTPAGSMDQPTVLHRATSELTIIDIAVGRAPEARNETRLLSSDHRCQFGARHMREGISRRR